MFFVITLSIAYDNYIPVRSLCRSDVSVNKIKVQPLYSPPSVILEIIIFCHNYYKRRRARTEKLFFFYFLTRFVSCKRSL